MARRQRPSRRQRRTGEKAQWLSRWNIARTLFVENNGKLLDDLSESHKLRFLYLSEMKESQRSDVPGIVAELKAAQAKGDRTPLGAAIRGALDELRGTTPAALVLATDGINTEGPGLLDAATYARRKGVPLLLIGLGSDRPARYLKLSDLDVEDVVFINDLVHFRFKFSASGFAGKKLAIVLREKKQPDGSPAEKARIEVTAGADGRAQEVVLPYRPTQTGTFRYTIERPAAGRRPGCSRAVSAFHPRGRRKGPRVAGRRLVPLGISLPPQPLGPRQDHRTRYLAAGRRRGLERARQRARSECCPPGGPGRRLVSARRESFGGRPEDARHLSRAPRRSLPML